MTEPNPGLNSVLAKLASFGCEQAYLKVLAENDNSKNQPYMGQSYEALHLLPHGELTTDGEGERTRVKAPLKLCWVSDKFEVALAPQAKLILYPQYPEIRLSGFLKGCATAPSKYMRARDQEGFLAVRRIMILGVHPTAREVFAYLAVEGGPAFAELDDRLSEFTEIGVFHDLTHLLPTKLADTKLQLLAKLAEIADKQWITSKRLDRNGNLMPCPSPNCGGYTLEAELGIIPNGYSEPDYLGWEVKQHRVSNFIDLQKSLLKRGSAITLMTPEPTGGVYANEGVEQFIRTYGYADRAGREDRLNFGGKFEMGKPSSLTGVRLEMVGFQSGSEKFDPTGSILLLRGDETTVAAEWKFIDLMKHWMRKHAKAVYVPSQKRTEPLLAYSYADTVRLGVGTDFLKFLHGIHSGVIFYDPGIKMENSSTKPRIKRRSQFRMHSADIPSLYSKMETIKSRP